MQKTRILLCTNAGLYSTLILQELLANPRIDIVGVLLSSRVRRKKGTFIGDIVRIYAKSGLRYLLYLASSTFFYSIYSIIFRQSSVKKLILQHNLPSISASDITNIHSKLWIQQQKPKILLSAFFNQWIDHRHLKEIDIIGLNLHPSILPAYGGVDPLIYQFLAEDLNLGITLHKLSENFDKGEIVSTHSMQREIDKTITWHYKHLFKLGVELINLYLDSSDMPDTAKHEKSETGIFSSYQSWPNSTQCSKLKNYLWCFDDLQL